MNFATINIQKIKTVAELTARFKHNRRLKISKNIRTEFLDKNLHDTENAPQYIKNRYKDINDERVSLGKRKIRKDFIPAVELVIGASGEFFKSLSESEILDWAQENIDWAEEFYKGKGKLITYDFHRDERQPHLHLIFMPESTEPDGTVSISAKNFVGNKSNMRSVRTSHAEANAKFGLVRGQDYFKTGAPVPKNLSLNELRRQTVQAKDDLDRIDESISESLIDYGVISHLDDDIKTAPKNSRIKNPWVQ